jgi:hypothetical protein
MIERVHSGWFSVLSPGSRPSVAVRLLIMHGIAVLDKTINSTIVGKYVEQRLFFGIDTYVILWY